MTTVHALAPAPAFTLLLARYLAGHIAQAHWDLVLAALDEADATRDERDALACFFLDATAAGAEVRLPPPVEIRDVLALARG